jgi:hypothetical protein
MSGSQDGNASTGDKGSGVFPGGDNGVQPPGINFRDVIDGLSNTIIVGERGNAPMPATPTGQKAWAAVWAGMANQSNDISRWRAIRGMGDYRLTDGNSLTGGPPPLVQPDEAFSSLHAGGVHFLMGDGAVRFVSLNIDWKPIVSPPTEATYGTYNRLSDRADGYVVGDF